MNRIHPFSFSTNDRSFDKTSNCLIYHWNVSDPMGSQMAVLDADQPNNKSFSTLR